MENAKTCLKKLSDYKREENDYALTKMEILVLNNKSRSDCNEFYAGQSKTIPFGIGENTGLGCEFEVQYPQNVVSGNEEWAKRSAK